MRYLLSLSLLALCSCSSMKKQANGSDAAPGLAGTYWTVSSLPGFNMEKTQHVVSISFADSGARFGGNTGCNGYGGTYNAGNDHMISFSKIIATKKACLPGMETENKVLGVLHSTDHYRISGDKLTLLQGEKVLAEFEKSKKPEK